MKRSIPVSVILSIVTCGIYGIYWMIMLNNELNRLSNHPKDMGGGLVFLLSIVTCGLYALFWYYKMGKQCDELRAMRGEMSDNSGVICLLVGLLGLGIINYCLMQDNINKTLEQPPEF